MILTVTINPLLETKLIFNSVSLNKTNRAEKQFLQCGGKGINVSRQLNLFNIDNLAFTFLGGTSGKLLKQKLTEEGIKFSSIRTEAETRTGFSVFNNLSNEVNSYIGLNSEITLKEVDEFKLKLEKMIPNFEMVVFSGSSPYKNCDDIFPFGIEIANKFDKISVCDTYGTHLKNCIEAKPTIIHNNKNEIETSLEILLNTEEDKINFLLNLYKNEIKQSFLTDGELPFYASTFDFIHKIIPPKIKSIDSTGSGDSFVSGIIYGWHKALVFEDILKISTALGAINASDINTSNVPLNKALEFKDNVIVNPVGKKIKTLDVTPR